MNLAQYLEESGRSQSDLAIALGVTQGTVSHWINGRVQIPTDRARAIEQATEGKVTPRDLWPELFQKDAA